jgi:predicted nucleic acid-binding protein
VGVAEIGNFTRSKIKIQKIQNLNFKILNLCKLKRVCKLKVATELNYILEIIKVSTIRIFKEISYTEISIFKKFQLDDTLYCVLTHPRRRLDTHGLSTPDAVNAV